MGAGRRHGKGAEESSSRSLCELSGFLKDNEMILQVLFYLLPTNKLHFCLIPVPTLGSPAKTRKKITVFQYRCFVLEHLTQWAPITESRANGSQWGIQKCSPYSPSPHYSLTPIFGYLENPGSHLLVSVTPDLLSQLQLESHLADECAQDHRTEDEIAEDARKDVPLPMDLARVDFIEELHQYEGVENNGIVLAGWGM